jgi:hypothetical protein
MISLLSALVSSRICRPHGAPGQAADIVIMERQPSGEYSYASKFYVFSEFVLAAPILYSPRSLPDSFGQACGAHRVIGAGLD